MTTNVTGTAPTVLALTREDLIRALRKRHPRASDERLGKLLDYRLACGTIDVIRSNTGEIDIQLTGAVRKN